MCIIAICKRPLTPDEFIHCHENNSDGWGVAWYTKTENPICVSKGYLKGSYYDYKDVIKSVGDMIHIIHFRLTSVGSTCAELTHPFPLDMKLLRYDALEYETRWPVLFHNGHFSEWQAVMISLAIQQGMINGKISDTKILAWAIASVMKHSMAHAEKLLEELDDKFVLMKPNYDMRIAGQFFDSDDKLVKFSNMSFRRKVFTLRAV